MQKAVDELGYVPNQAARALMTRRSDAIALLASEPATRVFGDPFFSGIVRGVSMETNRAGLQLVLMMAQDFEDLERVKRFLKSSPVDGVMLISGHDGDGLPEELERLAHALRDRRAAYGRGGSTLRGQRERHGG